MSSSKNSKGKQNAFKSKGKPPKKNASKRSKGSKDPVWWLFTATAANFASAAEDLDIQLKATYGPQVSISQFERMLVELSGLTEEHRALVLLTKDTLNLYELYIRARKARDDERDAFRVSKDVASVESSLAFAQELFSESKKEEEENEE
jgi:hypothetical protein